MQGMIERIILDNLVDDIELTPAVVLLGARQVGKTTLAKELSARIPSIYLDLESPKDVLALTDPEKFFHENADRLIILDEIH
ncbi:MAG: AAA family ATPase, partial [Gammaproteobacteria bacterium]|nr:AAA family ATPase [Gammaproteobacteria bacterium]